MYVCIYCTYIFICIMCIIYVIYRNVVPLFLYEDTILPSVLPSYAFDKSELIINWFCNIRKISTVAFSGYIFYTSFIPISDHKIPRYYFLTVALVKIKCIWPDKNSEDFINPAEKNKIFLSPLRGWKISKFVTVLPE